MKKTTPIFTFLLITACLIVPVTKLAPTVALVPTVILASQPPKLQATQSPTFTPSIKLVPSQTPTARPTAEIIVRFAVIGDYGSGNQNEGDVAQLIKNWNPDFIITTGDNNYPMGQASTIDHRVGQFFHDYIFPYVGNYGAGADLNRFFPTLGNHDWESNGAQPYFEYFTLPGNERYYDFVWGPVHFFAMDSDSNEPDGVSSNGVQAKWLKDQLVGSTSTWKIVYMHQPPYSSGFHGSVDWARWPYQSWGASAVLGGHDHVYERLIIDGIPYFVNGLGGGDIYYFKNILDGSMKRFAEDYGAMLVEADQESITYQFITRSGEIIDTYAVKANP